MGLVEGNEAMEDIPFAAQADNFPIRYGTDTDRGVKTDKIFSCVDMH